MLLMRGIKGKQIQIGTTRRERERRNQQNQSYIYRKRDKNEKAHRNYQTERGKQNK